MQCNINYEIVDLLSLNSLTVDQYNTVEALKAKLTDDVSSFSKLRVLSLMIDNPNFNNSLFVLKNLESLHLQGPFYWDKGYSGSDYLSFLPERIGELKSLTRLNFSGNCISSIPDSFGKLVNLTYLNGSHNKLTKVPADLCSLLVDNEAYVNLNCNHFPKITVPFIEKVTELPNGRFVLDSGSFKTKSYPHLGTKYFYYKNKVIDVEKELINSYLMTKLERKFHVDGLKRLFTAYELIKNLFSNPIAYAEQLVKSQVTPLMGELKAFLDFFSGIDSGDYRIL